MVEYIERDEAIRKALGACVKVVGRGITQIEAADVIDIMESIPIADVVEVVRCKDCKHNKYEQPNGIIHCRRNDNEGWIFRKTTDYCSCGEWEDRGENDGK